MLFQSAGFLFIFLPVFLAAMAICPKGRIKSLVLLVFSYLFYSGAEPLFCLILILSSTVDYTCGLVIGRARTKSHKMLYLLGSLVTNLGVLGFYKYGAMLLPTISPLCKIIGLPVPSELFFKGFVLPAGISFYTFQSMSYTIDVYRNKIQPEKDILTFFNYVAFLPQLIAGPIERFENLSPQIKSFVSNQSPRHWTAGLDRIALGIVQKLFIADSCGYVVDHLAQAGTANSFASSWGLAIGFGMQIYYDFAAYTHIAIGISLICGVRLSENFLSPYQAVNIQDFWRRWHVTLSNWFRDYLYIPLGGSKKNHSRTIINVFITFSLCGLWHGAGLNFVLWGILHGLLLGGFLIYKSFFKSSQLSRLIAVIITFLFISAAWIPFRIADPALIMTLWSNMIGLNGAGSGNLLPVIDLTIIGIITILTMILPNASKRWPGSSGWFESCAIMGCAIFAIFNTPEIAKFIYFQF